MRELKVFGCGVNLTSTLCVTAATLVAIDVWSYLKKKGTLKGAKPSFFFGLGSLVDLLAHPVEFWERQRDYDPKGVSTNTLCGRFMTFATDPKACRQIFIDTDQFVLFAHPNARYLFGDENLIYLPSTEHKKFRKMLTPGVYSKPALRLYLDCQFRVVQKHLKSLGETATERDVRTAFQAMNADASQEAFIGPYVSIEDKDALAQDIVTFTMGFLCFPVPFYGGGLWKAIKARERIREKLLVVCKRSKTYIQAGGEPRCVMDFWALETTKTDEDHPGTDDDEIASTVMDFMFASQDATTSSVLWALELLELHPEVFTKIREEVKEHNKGDFTTPLGEYYADLKYVHTCALEMLRTRPPVPMVPHLAKKDAQVQLGNGEVVSFPAGTMVIPSITFTAEHSEGYREFTPDKGAKDPQFNDVLVFGAGQHKCPGRLYAIQLLGCFLACLAEYDVKRTITDRSHKYMYLPTLLPQDNIYTFKPAL